jgi:hypothetical protein
MRSSPYSGESEDIRRMKSVCSLGMAGLPDLPWDYRRQNSRNFLSLHRITVSGLTRISSDAQSLQIFESNDQNSLSLFLNIGFFDLRLSTMSCCLSTRIRSPASRLNHVKMTRLRDCTIRTASKMFVPEAWSPEPPKSNKISWNEVFAEHASERDAFSGRPSILTLRDLGLLNLCKFVLSSLIS